MRRVAVVLAVLLPALGAGCASPADVDYEATFEAVPGSRDTYALRVLNATEGNVTIRIEAPSAGTVVRSGEVVEFARSSRGEFFFRVRSEETLEEAPSSVPTWTVTFDGLRARTYRITTEVERHLCSETECRPFLTGRVTNDVTVVPP